jgi:hypothetical protein
MGYIAKVYKSDGNTRVDVEILPNDSIEWKRNGVRGSYKGIVKSIGKCMRVRLLTHDGLAVSPNRYVNIKNHLLHAWRDGKDLSEL